MLGRITERSATPAEKLAATQMFNQPQFRFHTRDCMRSEAYAMYGINAEIEFTCIQPDFYEISVRHEPNSGRFSWNSPHTLMYMLQMLSARMVSLKGYPYFAFGHYRRPVGGLQIRVEGSSRYTQYCLRMLHTPEIPADALSRKVLWTKIRPAEPQKFDFSRDLIRSEFCW